MRAQHGWWLLLLGGCDDTLMVPPFDEGTVTTPTYTADWAGVQDLMADKCSNCHPTSGGFDVTVLETDVRGGTGAYVVAGDPAASLMYRLVTGQRIDGDPGAMPLGTGPLPAADTLGLEAWIASGATLPEGS